MRKEEFKIICINDTTAICSGLVVYKLSVFDINIYEYNRDGPKGIHLRLRIPNIGHDLFYKKDFMELSDYIMENRKRTIDQILD